MMPTNSHALHALNYLSRRPNIRVLGRALQGILEHCRSFSSSADKAENTVWNDSKPPPNILEDYSIIQQIPLEDIRNFGFIVSAILSLVVSADFMLSQTNCFQHDRQ